MSAESAAFYSTAAQVLPVLFLAIVFEQGILRRVEQPDSIGTRPVYSSFLFGIETGYPRGRLKLAFATLVVLFPIDLFVGEWLAVAATAGNRSDVSSYFVTGTLLIAGVVVILPVVWMAVPMLVPPTATGVKLRYRLARFVIVALATACAAFTALGVVLAIL
jgi:hypothetical protein